MKKDEKNVESRSGWALTEAGKADIARREEHRKTCPICAEAYLRARGKALGS